MNSHVGALLVRSAAAGPVLARPIGARRSASHGVVGWGEHILAVRVVEELLLVVCIVRVCAGRHPFYEYDASPGVVSLCCEEFGSARS